MSDNRDLPADARYPGDAGDGQETTPEEVRTELQPEDEVEEASEDSFPASDPPSFTGSTSSS